MQSCAPPVCKLGSDRAAYCAVVTDACEFNRGLSRDRASRLPFLDLATQTCQKPAPWLYRKPSDLSKGSLAREFHIHARYTRHRWSLNQIDPVKRRKLAADRLWYNLQNGLGALGVPAELIPSVTQRAFTLANLPIPDSFAAHLESSGITRTPTATLTTSSSTAMNIPFGSKFHSTGMMSIMTRRTFESSFEQASRKPNVDPIEVVEDTARLSKPLSTNQTARFEDGTLSTDASGQRRNLADERDLTDLKFEDEVLVNGTKVVLTGEVNQLKSYELDDDSEEAEDVLADVLEDEEEDIDEEELDDDDDVEWVQSRGKRSYSACGNTNKALSSRRHRRRTMQGRKGSRFTSPVSRFSERRIIRGRPFVVASQDKLRLNLRSSDSTETSTIDSLVPRRSGRFHTTAKTKMTSSIRASKEKESAVEDRWISYAEPGFQPNSSFLPMVDRDYPDSGPVRDMDERTIIRSYPVESTAITTTKDTLTTLRDHTKLASTPSLPHAPDFLSYTSGQITNSNSVSTVNRQLPDAPAQAQSAPATSFTVPVASRTTMAQLLASANSTVPLADMTTAGNSGTSLEYAPSSTMHSGRPYSAVNEPADCKPTMFTPRASVISQLPIRQQGVSRDSSEHPTGSNTNRSAHDFAAITRYAMNCDNPTPVTVNLESFATPQVATTTVTFFVCEVCASRYRSTAGLRYHYHSQHSGYTPKNPISASASRLVVPIGEERGIGGGLRGGRPRRHKVDGRQAQSARGTDFEPRPKTPSYLNVTDIAPASHTPSSTANISSDRYCDSNVRGLSATNVGDTVSSFALSYTSSNRSVIPTRPGSRIPATEFFCSSASLVDSAEMKSNDAEHSRSVTPNSRTTEGLVELQRAQRPVPSYTLDNAQTTMGFGHPHYASSLAVGSTHNSQVNWSSPDTYRIAPQQQQPPTIYHPPPFRLTPHQRRVERQRCPDRANSIAYIRPPIHGSTTTNCVYCLGDERLNSRLGRPEGLLRCARCSSLAHFTCLHLPTHVIDNAMRYPWQCIECKTCWLCGSPEQENRMIFCGDCDRVFHVDCLPIPVSRLPPPTAHWSCDICLHDLYAMTDVRPNAGSGADTAGVPARTAVEPTLYSGSS